MPQNSAAGSESLLARKRRARKINKVLGEFYPYAHPELDFRNPFELLVATVLSAQTTDVRVNQVTPSLFARYPGPAEMARADLQELEAIIQPAGFFRAKAKNLVAMSTRLVQHYDGEVPASVEELITLAGVGRKTANVVLGNAFGIPGITVDTHFGRLARRFEWTTSEDPEVVEREVGELVERKDWTMLSHRVVFHGRRVCHSRRPACGACVVAQWCPSFGMGETDPAKAAKLLKYELAPGQEALREAYLAQTENAAAIRMASQRALLAGGRTVEEAP